METILSHRRRKYSSVLIVAVLTLLTMAVAGGSARAAFATIHDFLGSPTDGSEPYGTTVSDGKGNLFGTTSDGGKFGLGVVYELTAGGTVAILHSFGGPDGSKPTCTLILEPSTVAGASPELFGTTLTGGKANLGVLFKLTVAGSGYTVLHDFLGGAGDGANPWAGVILASDNYLHGTTLFGGGFNFGTTYRILRSGSGFGLTHKFTGNTPGVPPDGAYPYARLFEWEKGKLVGTTADGGGQADDGTVFSQSLTGSTYGLLHSFVGTPDGAHPTAELITVVNPAGGPILWGTARDGGAAGVGIVYSLTPGGGAYTVEYSFLGVPDGANPFGALIAMGSPTVLLGTTVNGGPSGNGVAYMVNPFAAAPIPEGIVHGFIPGEGEHPYAALMMPAGGGLVSTTRDGGQLFDGTVFQL